MKTLLTGFNGFGALTINPSQLVTERIAARAKKAGVIDLTAEILPTEFAGAGVRIAQLIRKLRPEVIICLGVAQGIDAIHLERVALNLDDTESPDNAGLTPRGTAIKADGPPAYWSTLPIERMRLELRQRGIAARISNHAGTYVCNHVFYVARHEVNLLGLPAVCGFIHLPALVESKSTPVKPGLALETMIEAVEDCLSLAREPRQLSVQDAG